LVRSFGSCPNVTPGANEAGGEPTVATCGPAAVVPLEDDPDHLFRIVGQLTA